jgi:hypothetical protein
MNNIHKLFVLFCFIIIIIIRLVIRNFKLCTTCLTDKSLASIHCKVIILYNLHHITVSLTIIFLS